MAARLLIVLALLHSLASATASVPIPVPIQVLDSLPETAVHARKNGLVTIILLTLPDCSSCEYVKTRHLIPLQSSLEGKALLREIVLSDQPLVDYDGTTTTAEEFAQRYGANFAPTVLFLDADGKRLSKSLVGLSSRDFYGFYLEKSIDNSFKKMKQQSASNHST